MSYLELYQECFKKLSIEFEKNKNQISKDEEYKQKMIEAAKPYSYIDIKIKQTESLLYAIEEFVTSTGDLLRSMEEELNKKNNTELLQHQITNNPNNRTLIRDLPTNHNYELIERVTIIQNILEKHFK